MKYILSLDQGTTSSRAILFEKSGRVAAVAQREFPQHFPKPGWVEHSPEDIWESQFGVIREVMDKGWFSPKDVGAIGITNQRETVVIWDRKTGKPIAPAIVWQDRRTAPLCDAIRAKGGDKEIRKKTGLVLDSYFSATKVAWILDHVKSARARARAGDLAMGTIDSWLVWNLTGGRVHATDPTNASRTMLYNIHSLMWDESLLSLFGIPASLLPEVRPSSGYFGETQLFGGSIPITGIAGDQQAALFGQACMKPGMVKNTYGTGCFMLMNTGVKPINSKNHLLTTIAWQIGEKTEYALEGSIFIAGAVVQWLRDGLGIIKSSAEVEDLAKKVPDNGGVYLVPAFTGLGAPHWDSYARGTLVGLTRGANSSHIARAALEGIAHQVVDVLKSMEADAGIKLKELRVDGGASRNNLLMQIQADLLGVPVVRSRETETTALGAAFLAGLAVNFWKSSKEIGRQWSEESRFKPGLSLSKRECAKVLWQKALSRAKSWAE